MTKMISTLKPVESITKIVQPTILRADKHHVFAEPNDSHYLVFVTSLSCTADNELMVALGVHGSKNLYVWIVDY